MREDEKPGANEEPGDEEREAIGNRFGDLFASFDEIDRDDEEAIVSTLRECQSCLTQLGLSFTALLDLISESALPEEVRKLFPQLDTHGRTDNEAYVIWRQFRARLAQNDLTFRIVLDLLFTQEGPQEEFSEDAERLRQLLEAYKLANEELKVSEQVLLRENERLNRLVRYFDARSGKRTVDVSELVDTVRQVRSGIEPVLIQLKSFQESVSTSNVLDYYRVQVACALQKKQAVENGGIVTNALVWVLRRMGHEVSMGGIHQLQDLVKSLQRTLDEQSEFLQRYDTLGRVGAKLQEQMDLILGNMAPQDLYEQAMEELRVLHLQFEELKLQAKSAVVLQEGMEHLRRENEQLHETIENMRASQVVSEDFNGSASSPDVSTRQQWAFNGGNTESLGKENERLKQRVVQGDKDRRDLERQLAETQAALEKARGDEVLVEALGATPAALKEVLAKLEALHKAGILTSTELARQGGESLLGGLKHALHSIVRSPTAFGTLTGCSVGAVVYLHTSREGIPDSEWGLVVPIVTAVVAGICSHMAEQKALFGRHKQVMEDITTRLDQVRAVIEKTEGLKETQLDEIARREKHASCKIAEEKRRACVEATEQLRRNREEITRWREDNEGAIQMAWEHARRDMAAYRQEEQQTIDRRISEAEEREESLDAAVRAKKMELGEFARKVRARTKQLRKLERRIPALQAEKEREVIDRYQTWERRPVTRESGIKQRETCVDRLEQWAREQVRSELSEEFEHVRALKHKLENTGVTVEMSANQLHFIHVIGLMRLSQTADRYGLSMSVSIDDGSSLHSKVISTIRRLYEYAHMADESARRWPSTACRWDGLKEASRGQYAVTIKIQGDLEDIQEFLPSDFSKHLEALGKIDVEDFYATPRFEGAVTRDGEEIQNIIYAPFYEGLAERMSDIASCLDASSQQGRGIPLDDVEAREILAAIAQKLEAMTLRLER